MKKCFSKKVQVFLLILFCVSMMFFYIGSYRYLRNKSISLHEANKKGVLAPPGYLIDITFGVGLGKSGAVAYGFDVDSKGSAEFCNWLLYLYYPLIRLEMKQWKNNRFPDLSYL